MEDFYKPKIIWKRIGSIIRFCYCEEDMMCLDSTVIATGNNVKYLTAVLNSKLHIWDLLINSPKNWNWRCYNKCASSITVTSYAAK